MKIFSGIIAPILLFITPFGISADAAVTDGSTDIMPMFNYIEDAGCTLIITESGKATFTADISGDYNDVIMIEIYVKLQKKNGSNWTDIATNNNVFYDDSGYCEGTYYLTQRGTYRAEATFTVYTSTDIETVTLCSSQKTY